MTADTQAPAPASTADMVLVPREPTPEMIAAMLIYGWDDPDHEASSVGHQWVREAMYHAALTAAPPASASTMGVKELVWEATTDPSEGRVHYGTGVFGHWYAVARAKAKTWSVNHHVHGKNVVVGLFESFDAAKGAAQLDYARRIQSCVTNPLAGDPIGYLKPDGPWTMGDRYIDAKSRTEDWMLSVFTVPVYGAPLAGEAGAVEADLTSRIACEIMSLEWARGGDDDEHAERYGALQEAIEPLVSAHAALSTTLPKAETETASDHTLTRSEALDALAADYGETMHAETAPERERLVEAVRDVLAERERQKSVEGYSEAHDDIHQHGQLGAAAACYALSGSGVVPPIAAMPPGFWPWDLNWWKPTTARRDLVKAGALLLAEIERIDRAALSTEKGR